MIHLTSTLTSLHWKTLTRRQELMNLALNFISWINQDSRSRFLCNMSLSFVNFATETAANKETILIIIKTLSTSHLFCIDKFYCEALHGSSQISYNRGSAQVHYNRTASLGYGFTVPNTAC